MTRVTVAGSKLVLFVLYSVVIHVLQVVPSVTTCYLVVPQANEASALFNGSKVV